MINTPYYNVIILVLIFFLGVKKNYGQVNKLTKVCKPKTTYQVPTENGFNPCIKKKTKDHWVVYSDRNNNQSYKDSYAQYPNGKINFLESCVVINEKNGFLELVKYNKEILPPRKGLIPSILKKEKRFHFDDVKKVEYIGWIHQSKLLLNRNAWVATENLKPLRYILQIGEQQILLSRDSYLKNDTVISFVNPSLNKQRISENKIPLLGNIVYLYKESEDKKSVLLGFTPYFSDENKEHVFGWVDKRIVLDIGQQQVFVPKTGLNSMRGYEIAFSNHELAVEKMEGQMSDSTYLINRELIDIQRNRLPFLFNRNLQSENQLPSEQPTYSTVVPTEIWDHSPNKVINITGQFINYPQFRSLKKSTKELNIILIFEKSQSANEKLLYLTNSIQKVWSILQKEEFVGYHPHFSAICFDKFGVIKEFRFSDIFVNWLDFIQNTAEEIQPNLVSNYSDNGLEKALNRCLERFKSRSGQTNLAIIAGTGIKSFDGIKVDKLGYEFAKSSTRLLFWQLENEADDAHTDFILAGKSLLYITADFFSQNKRHYLVDHALDKRKNVLVLTNETTNSYLFDYPESSMYQGGIAFPKINKSLHPVLFDEVLETLLLQIAEDNSAVESSLQEYFDGIGLERSKPHPNLIRALNLRNDWNNNNMKLPKSSYDDKYWVNHFGVEDSINMVTDHYFLLTVQEHESLVNVIKRLAPVTPEKINRKFSKKITRSYKKYYKELRGIHCKNGKAKNASVTSLIFMSTGIATSNKEYEEVPIKNLKKKKKMPREELRNYLTELRTIGNQIEKYPTLKQHDKYKIQDLEYLLIPAIMLP